MANLRNIFLFLGILVGFYLSINLFPDRIVLDTLGFKASVVKSNSMYPHFSLGDMIILTKTNTNDLKKDDIIAFERRNKQRVAHYIDKQIINDNKLLFKTKSHQGKDYEAISRKQIIGKVAFHIKYIGHIILFFKVFLVG